MPSFQPKNKVPQSPSPGRNSPRISTQTAQFKNNRPETTSQLKVQQMANPVVQKLENNTGMPDQLKSGIENLSGMDMSDVKVHYNSPKPAQLQAHAYAQGNQIHLGAGQEKHLPHEAWHVVQQKQGRVQPTKQLKGKVNINDDDGLEKEADVMGAKALQMKQFVHIKNQLSLKKGTSYPIQFKTLINYGPLAKFTMPDTSTINVGTTVKASLDPKEPRKGSDTSGFSGWGTALRDLKTDNGSDWVAGHLLNHDLGGRGIINNFFPITKAANSQHLWEVEYPVKGWLSKGHEIQYDIAAKQGSAASPDGEFDCVAKVTKTADGEEKPADLHKIVKSKSVKVLHGGKMRHAETENAGDYTEARRRAGVPVTWKHNRGGAADRTLEGLDAGHGIISTREGSNTAIGAIDTASAYEDITHDVEHEADFTDFKELNTTGTKQQVESKKWLVEAYNEYALSRNVMALGELSEMIESNMDEVPVLWQAMYRFFISEIEKAIDAFSDEHD